MRATMLIAMLLAVAAAWPLSAHAAERRADRVLVAQADNPFSALVGDRRQRPRRRGGVEIERYVLAADDRAFVFENRVDEARVVFLCGEDDPRLDCRLDPSEPAPEIHALLPTRAPRGDVIYKNAQGETLLRIASYGGATVYWPGAGRGFAASKSFGDDEPLRLPEADADAVARRAQAATALISAETGAPIIFDLGESVAEAAAISPELADAVVRAANGLHAVAQDPTGARIIASRISRVVFIADAAPGVGITERTLEIRYAAGLDIEGRPSSAAVARFLEQSL
ncbi:MAG: DUF4908 domain-containing protein [Hyphococcus sp.]